MRPLWLTSVDVENGVSLKWEEAFTDDSSPHGKYRMEATLVTDRQSADSDSWWKSVGPRCQPILGNSYCLDLPLHATSEQEVRLLALTKRDNVHGWLNCYKRVRLPSRRQLLPAPVEGLRAHAIQSGTVTGDFSVRLDWSAPGQSEGETMLEKQLEPGHFFTPCDTSYRIEVHEGYGLWREIETLVGSKKNSFVHKNPTTGSTLCYRVTPVNSFGEGASVEAPAIHLPKRLSELQG
ncbi:unnamed protein product [Mesocestoides corti]|uniref:Fibronectin type-III domain-containing protein n=1 Tax=Mesocestoides corti TaxID=53468 RepID=A0A0R3UNY0_MESCO|nr:unnamed protein product [Mesocestoides corti]